MNGEQPAASSARPASETPLAVYGLLLARLIVGGVLVYAGFSKAVHPAAEFEAAIEAYKILPAFLLGPAALAVPYLEMWVGLFVLTGFFTRWASVAAAVIFAGFLTAIGSTFARGIELATCGCFGGENLSPRSTVYLDLFLMTCSIISAALSTRISNVSIDSWLKNQAKK